MKAPRTYLVFNRLHRAVWKLFYFFRWLYLKCETQLFERNLSLYGVIHSQEPGYQSWNNAGMFPSRHGIKPHSSPNTWHEPSIRPLSHPREMTKYAIAAGFYDLKDLKFLYPKTKYTPSPTRSPTVFVHSGLLNVIYDWSWSIYLLNVFLDHSTRV